MPEEAMRDLDDARAMYPLVDGIYDEWCAELMPLFSRKIRVGDSERARAYLRDDVMRFAARQLRIDLENYCGTDEALGGTRLYAWEESIRGLLTAMSNFIMVFPSDLAAALLCGELSTMFDMVARLFLFRRPQEGLMAPDEVAAEAAACVDRLEAEYSLLDEDDQALVLRYLMCVIQARLKEVYRTNIVLLPDESEWVTDEFAPLAEMPYLSDWAGRLVVLDGLDGPHPLYPERFAFLYERMAGAAVG